MKTFLGFENRVLHRFLGIPPEKLRVFYIGGYWRGANDMVAQMRDGLRATGASVVEFNTDNNRDALDSEDRPYERGTNGPVWLVREKLFPRIRDVSPHVIVCNAGGLSFRPADADELRDKNVKLMGIVLSDPDMYAPTTSKTFRNFDIIYSNDRATVDLYRKGGVRAYQLPIATNDLFFRPMPEQPEYVCEVLHLGAAHQDRIEPVKALIKHFETHVYGERWEDHGIPSRGLILGEETLKALNSAKVTVVFSRTPFGRQTVKVGLFDFLAAGALVATEDFPELHNYFGVKDLVVFNGIGEMLEKIRYYCDHPKEADLIRKAGREKVLANFTWEKTWPSLLARAVHLRGWEAPGS